MGPNMRAMNADQRAPEQGWEADEQRPWTPLGALPPNPKQSYGDKKVPLHLIPPVSLIHEAMALRDGARKYGPYNWRYDPVEAMTYIGAAMRHILAWLDGEELAPDSMVHHLGHAKACLAILLDAEEVGKLLDNRPPGGNAGDLMEALADR